MKHHHTFRLGERVWDWYHEVWANVIGFHGVANQSGGLVLRNDEGDVYHVDYSDVYQIARGYRTACSGDIVCYEHNETEDGYAYYCPELGENFFESELVRVDEKEDRTSSYDADLTEGSACELAQKLQNAVLSVDGPKATVPVYVEDENGRLENIVHIWYDSTRQMIRLSVGGVEFQDSEE